MTLTLRAVLAAVLLQPALVHTQPKTDFTGSWTMVAARSQSPLQTPPITSQTHNITQTDASLTVETIRDDRRATVTFTIETEPKPTAGSMGAGAARAYWDGAKLVTERAGTVQGQTVTIKVVRELSADGQEMTVQSLVAVQHGYTLRGARNYGTAIDVFTRVP